MEYMIRLYMPSENNVVYMDAYNGQYTKTIKG